MSYFAADPGWWAVVRDTIPRPFPREAAMMDLRWWQDRALLGLDAFPSRTALGAIWGWDSEKRVRTLLAADDEWGDPAKAQRWSAWKAAHGRGRAGEGPAKGQARAGEGPDKGRPPLGESVTSDDERAGEGPDEGQARAGEGPAKGHTRVDPPTPTPTPTRETPPSPPAGGQLAFGLTAEDPTEPDRPSPLAWARRVKGRAPVDVDAVVAAIEAIRGGPVNPQRIATDAKQVIGLQAATGTPWRELAEDLALVARWAQTSADPLAANDIRGHDPRRGQWGTDRSRNVSTLTVHSRWSDRLAAARRWRDGGERDPPAQRPRRGHHPGVERTEEELAAVDAWVAEYGVEGFLGIIDAPEIGGGAKG